MIYAGVDPGTLKAGIAVVEARGTAFRGVLVGVVTLPSRASMDERIFQLYRELVGVFRQHRPLSVGIEDAFLQKDPRVTIALGRAQAAAMIAAKESSARVMLMAPTSARKVAMGKGNAKKAEAARFVKILLGIGRELPLDASDAAILAVAAACRCPAAPEHPPDDLKVDRQIRKSWGNAR